MKRNKIFAYLSLGVVFALFNIIAFVIPTEKSFTFWAAYIFTVVAFLLQPLVWKMAFAKKDTLKSRFLGISVISVGVYYLIIQLIVFAVFMAAPFLPEWIAIVVSSVVLAFFLLSAFAGLVGANEVNRVEKSVKDKRVFIQFLLVDVEMIAEAEKDAEMKQSINRLADIIRFSDPMSHSSLAELENRISSKVSALKESTEKKDLIFEIELLLTERNKKCKVLK